MIGACLALFSGDDVNGAHRWLDFGGFKLQPSEFLKPAFAVLGRGVPRRQVEARLSAASWSRWVCLRRRSRSCSLQPDVGQTLLLSDALRRHAVLRRACLLLAGGVGRRRRSAWRRSRTSSSPCARARRAVSRSTGDGYQTGLALKAFEAGRRCRGRARAPARSSIGLPDAHTDFIFAVAGEEFGMLLCVLIALCSAW